MEKNNQLSNKLDRLHYILNKSILYCFFFTLILYNSHRYLFKYNSTATSPTYSNTPIFWKLLKYVLLTLYLVIFYINNKHKRLININLLLIYGFVFIFFTINILNFLIYSEVIFDEFEFIIYFLILFPIGTISSSFIELIRERIPISMKFTAIFIISTSLIVIFNYFIFGRLPALAYKDSFLVRFGAFWDDPNGVGFLCVYLFFYFLQLRKHLITTLLFITIIITISFSSYILLLAGSLYWSELRSLKIKRKWMHAFTLIAPLVIAGIVYQFDTLTRIYELKKGSILAHLDFNFKLSLIPLFNQSLKFHESWLVSFFFNYFPFSVVPLYFVFIFLYKSFFIIERDFIGFYIFLFLVGCMFIPFTYVFPINFIFIILLLLYLRGIRLWTN